MKIELNKEAKIALLKACKDGVLDTDTVPALKKFVIDGIDNPFMWKAVKCGHIEPKEIPEFIMKSETDPMWCIRKCHGIEENEEQTASAEN